DRLGVAMDARGALDWIGDRRLRLRDISFRGATFRCSFTLPRARGAWSVHSDQALRSVLHIDCWRRASFRSGHSRRSGRISGPVDRPMVVRRVDCVGAERHPQRRNAGAVYRNGDDFVCRDARTAMVAASRVVHTWNGSNGWPGSASEELISLPGDLDVAALDSGDGAEFADTARGTESNKRRCTRISARAEYSTVGGRALLDGVVRSSVTAV